jgi:hypothetical protein
VVLTTIGDSTLLLPLSIDANEAREARERRFTLEGRFSAVIEMVRKDAIVMVLKVGGWWWMRRFLESKGEIRGLFYTQQCLGNRVLPR